MALVLNRERLFAICAEFDRQAMPWKKDALYRSGCSFCCTHFGNVDATTLEALNVHDFMASLPNDERNNLLTGEDSARKPSRNSGGNIA
jgi:hypothetical protein